MMIFQANLRMAFTELQRWGFKDAILPFFLFFAILFAVLQKIELFKDEKGNADRRLNGIIAFVMSAMIIIPHIIGAYPSKMDPVMIMYNILPGSAVIIISLIFVMLLVGLAGGKIPSVLILLAGLGSIAIIAFIILSNVFPEIRLPWLDPKLQALIVTILIFGLVVYFIVRSPEQLTPEEKKAKQWKWLYDLFSLTKEK